MKALTILQPYPALICLPEVDTRHKRVENRGWYTEHRGALAIHAGKSRKLLEPEDEGLQMEFGAVVAIADLVDIFHISALNLRQPKIFERYPWLEGHQHVFGPQCWVLQNVRPIEPIPYVGKQGLWDIPDSLLPASI